MPGGRVAPSPARNAQEVPPEDQAHIRKRLITEFACCPVYLTDKVSGPYYNGFANAELWPRFHYEQRGVRDEPLDWAWWDAYRTANGEFCEVVANIAQSHDMIWVHDYHLMLLPQMLRARVPGATIGWFLHTPFPASATFRTLPVRTPLLEGLLAADTLGFHTFDYCRHFVSACSRILPGVEVTPTSVTTADGRTCQVMVDPIGIEPDDFLRIARSDACQRRVAELRRQFEGVHVIVAVDRLDPIKGIPHRLLGLRTFFAAHPEFIGRVTLVQVAVPSRVDVDAYRKLTETVNVLVGSINGEFSTLTCQAIHYFYRRCERWQGARESQPPSREPACRRIATVLAVLAALEGHAAACARNPRTQHKPGGAVCAVHGGGCGAHYKPAGRHEPGERGVRGVPARAGGLAGCAGAVRVCGRGTVASRRPTVQSVGAHLRRQRHPPSAGDDPRRAGAAVAAAARAHQVQHQSRLGDDLRRLACRGATAA